MVSEKKRLLEKIANTYCRIRHSDISGVGVFAIRGIPKNTNIFFGVKNECWMNFKLADFKGMHKEVIKMIDDFFVTSEKGIIEVPSCGLNGINISFFLNHSLKPNVKTIDCGENFITIRKIKKGEELTVDYDTIK